MSSSSRASSAGPIFKYPEPLHSMVTTSCPIAKCQTVTIPFKYIAHLKMEFDVALQQLTASFILPLDTPIILCIASSHLTFWEIGAYGQK